MQDVDLDNIDPDTPVDLDDDDDDDDETNTTQPFTPGAASTPYHGGEELEMSHLPQEQSGQDGTRDTEPLLEGDELDQRLQQRNQASPWSDLTDMYPDANKLALEVSYQKDKKGTPRLWIKMAGRGKKAYPLYTQSAVTRQLRENPQLSQEMKAYLGKTLLDQIDDFRQERDRKQKELAAKQKQKQQLEKTLENRDKLHRDLDAMRKRIQDDDDRIRELEEAHGPLNTEEIQRLKEEKRALESDHQSKRQQMSQLQKNAKQADEIQKDIDKLRLDNRGLTERLDELRAKKDALKPLDELKQKAAELNQQITEDIRVIEDENTSPSDREAARDRLAVRNEELEGLSEEIQVRERQRPLLERVKEIFKKYGWTLQAVVLAAGITNSAVVLATLNGLKAATKSHWQWPEKHRQTGSQRSARPHRLDSELHLQSCRASHLLSCRTRLAAHPCRGGLPCSKGPQTREVVSLSHPSDKARQSKHTYSNEGLVHMMRLNRVLHCGRWWVTRVWLRVCGCLWWGS